MCGRFTQSLTWSDLLALFRLTGGDEAPGFGPRFNIAPGAHIAVVRHDEHGAGRQLALVRWGLVPFWAKDSAFGARTINARAETVAEKPAFRMPFARRRCLVAADGFYEWQPRPPGPKQPHYIGLPETGLYAFGGLWDAWRGPAGGVVETCTIVTTEAEERLKPIHDRMPLILAESQFDAWLDPTCPPLAVRALLAPFDGPLRVHPVGRRVNDARNDGPELRNAAGEL